MNDDSSFDEARTRSGKSPYGLRNAVRTPPRGINHPIQYQPHLDPAGAKPLIHSSHMDANPLGLWVTVGDSPRVSDIGDRFSNWIKLVYHLRSPEDAKHIKLEAVIAENDHQLGQSLLRISFPANSQSQYNDFVMIEGKAEVAMQVANFGNGKYRSNVQTRIEKTESQLAETPPGTIKSMLLRLPIDMSTDLPYTCHISTGKE